MKMKRKEGFWAGAAVLFFLLPAFIGCDNAVNPDSNSPASSSLNDNTNKNTNITVTYYADGPELSQFLGYQWEKQEYGSDLEFKWVFKDDGTITVIHCCGADFSDQFNYFLCGNVLVTYGDDADPSDKDIIEVTAITMTNTGNKCSFKWRAGISFIQGEENTDSSSDAPLVLSNVLLGTWQGADGTEYEFKSDATLSITSPAGSEQDYGYLARNGELLTLGPLVDGKKAVLQKYKFSKNGNNLSLNRSDGQKYNLSK